jgi:ankyrin repeat protein
MNPEQEMIEAVKAGDVVKVKELIAGNPALVQAKNESRVSAILLATYYGRQEVVDALLASGPELDIFEAAAVGTLDRVAELLKSDSARVHAYSPDGFPPLGLAAFFGHKDIVEFLLANGADPDAVSHNAMRVRSLHAAAAHRRPAVALAISEILLAHGAKANVAQTGGVTPLHEAAAHGHDDLVTLLLAHGAEVNLKSEDGNTPLQMALERGHPDTAELLRRHGATEAS